MVKRMSVTFNKNITNEVPKQEDLVRSEALHVALQLPALIVRIMLAGQIGGIESLFTEANHHNPALGSLITSILGSPGRLQGLLRVFEAADRISVYIYQIFHKDYLLPKIGVTMTFYETGQKKENPCGNIYMDVYGNDKPHISSCYALPMGYSLSRDLVKI